MPNHKKALPIIAFSVGEPAGIGPDIAVKLAQHALPCCLVVIANGELLLSRAKQLGISLKIKPFSGYPEPHQKDSLLVQDLALGAPVTAGQLNSANAEYVLKGISLASTMCLEGKADAMVTGPVHKGIINEAGTQFSGHTEWIAQLCRKGAAVADDIDVVMMLASNKLKVALATTHIPLSEVPKQISQARLEKVLTILHRSLQTQFGMTKPRIAVCGLNPHAGENGHIGHEEQEIIIPSLQKLKQQGLNLSGPIPADTLFAPKQAEQYDAILAMYHDQGLAPLKACHFGDIVNITLGLPIIRTSVDHGTALDIAGSKLANESSLLLAVNYAIKLAQLKIG